VSICTFKNSNVTFIVSYQCKVYYLEFILDYLIIIIIIFLQKFLDAHTVYNNITYTVCASTKFCSYILILTVLGRDGSVIMGKKEE